MTPELRAAIGARDVLAEVYRRLRDAGAILELQHLKGMSVEELDIVVMREAQDFPRTAPVPVVVKPAPRAWRSAA